MVNLFFWVRVRTLFIYFNFSDNSEVKQELHTDDSGKIPAYSQKRTASEVCLPLA